MIILKFMLHLLLVRKDKFKKSGDGYIKFVVRILSRFNLWTYIFVHRLLSYYKKNYLIYNLCVHLSVRSSFRTNLLEVSEMTNRDHVSPYLHPWFNIFGNGEL